MFWLLIHILSSIIVFVILYKPYFWQETLRQYLLSYGIEEDSLFHPMLFFVISFVVLFMLFRKKEMLVRTWEKLSLRLGKWIAVLFLALFLVPQRIMDNNSNYVFINPESPICWILSLSDLVRSVSALGFFISMLSLNSNELRVETNDNPYFKLNRFFLIIPPMVGLLFQLFFLENIPHVQDEVVQDWQARLFASRRIKAPDIPYREPFTTWGICDNGQGFYSSFQPGFAILLSLFVPFSMTAWVNPLLGLLILLILYELLLRSYGKEIGDLACFLLGLSPFFLMMMSGRMNHVAALLYLVICFRGLLSFTEGHSLTSGIICGISCGLCLMTRRVDGGVLLVALLACIAVANANFRDKISFLFAFIVFAGITGGIQIIMNAKHSGDSFQMMRQVQTVVANEISETPFVNIIKNITDNLFGFAVYAFGGIIPGFIGFSQLKFGKKVGVEILEGFLLLHCLLLLIVYGAYNYQDFCYGPRFLFSLLPIAILGAAKGILVLQGTFSPRIIKKWLLVGFAFSIFFLLNQGVVVLGNRFWNVDRNFEKFIKKEIPTPAVVFLKSPTRKVVEIIHELKKIGIDKETLSKLVENSAVDFETLKESVRELKVQNIGKIKSLIDRFIVEGNYRPPSWFDISESEVIRLNTPDIYDNSLIVALDLGDEPCKKLLSYLPQYKGYMVYRKGETFAKEPFVECGIPRFQ